jgi:hypothetical protein
MKTTCLVFAIAAISSLASGCGGQSCTTPRSSPGRPTGRETCTGEPDRGAALNYAVLAKHDWFRCVRAFRFFANSAADAEQCFLKSVATRPDPPSDQVWKYAMSPDQAKWSLMGPHGDDVAEASAWQVTRNNRDTSTTQSNSVARVGFGAQIDKHYRRLDLIETWDVFAASPDDAEVCLTLSTCRVPTSFGESRVGQRCGEVKTVGKSGDSVKSGPCEDTSCCTSAWTQTPSFRIR